MVHPPVPPPAGEQAPGAASASPQVNTRVFLDCPGGGGGADQCFSAYLREKITFVDFVRQPQDADVLVIAHEQETGGGGRAVVLRFVGQNRFAGHDHDFRAVSRVSDTETTRREVVLRTAIIGLLDYLAEDGIPPGVNVSVSTEAEQANTAPADDPWNAWVFSIRGSGSIEADARSKEREAELVLNADRVTNEWKLSFGSRATHRVEAFDLDEDEPLEVVRRDRNFNWFVARSLGAHWSFGVQGRARSSTFSNIALSISTAPAVEYSVFPYDEYATRQLRLQYDIGVDETRYYEETIFEKTRERLVQQEASAVLDQRQPWGSLRAGATFSQYLHDRSRYRLETDGTVNVRLLRGLSLNLSGSASRIHDQLSLPLRDASEEEVLLRIRQLGSSFEYRFNFGLTYSFGSIFNNVINPRFDD
jgi:hypothetical protein